MTTKPLSEIRDDYGLLPAYAWPGGYPIFYLDRDNSTLCPDCANADESGAEAWDTYLEGPTIHCDECNAEIESAYGDPDNPEENKQ